MTDRATYLLEKQTGGGAQIVEGRSLRVGLTAICEEIAKKHLDVGEGARAEIATRPNSASLYEADVLIYRPRNTGKVAIELLSGTAASRKQMASYLAGLKRSELSLYSLYYDRIDFKGFGRLGGNHEHASDRTATDLRDYNFTRTKPHPQQLKVERLK